MAETVDPALVDWSGVEEPPQPALPTVPASEVDWGGVEETVTAPASAVSGLPTVNAAEVDWGAIEEDDRVGIELGVWPTDTFVEVAVPPGGVKGETVLETTLSLLQDPRTTGVPETVLKPEWKDIGVNADDRTVSVEINPHSGEEWLHLGDVPPEEKPPWGGRPVGAVGVQADAERRAARGQVKRNALDLLARRVFEHSVFPEDQMPRAIPHMVMSLREGDVVREDPNDPEMYWIHLPDADPKHGTAADVELLSRALLSHAMQQDRDHVRSEMRKHKDPQVRAQKLYDFMRAYYPRAAAKVAQGRGGELFEDITVAPGEPWYASIHGFMNLLDISIPALAVSRKVGVEMKNVAIRERLIQGQYGGGAAPFDDVEEDIVSDYLTTNKGHRMANGNYLLPFMGGRPDTPSVWPEDLEPHRGRHAPLSADPSLAEMAVSGTYIGRTGIPGIVTIEGMQYSVLSPGQFRTTLLDDLQNHVSFLGNLEAPKRWAGIDRTFSEVDPSEAWRRLGFRRFIGYGTGPEGREHITGEHFPGFRRTTKKDEYGEDVEVDFAEDLALVVSALGGPGRGISDTMAHESGKDIAAIGSLPYRGVEDLFAMSKENALRGMEFLYPKGAREPGEIPETVDIPDWAVALVPALGVPIPEIEPRSQQIWAELAEGGEEGKTGFKYDPEVGIDPLGNFTFEMASLFATDPYGAAAAAGLAGLTPRVGSSAWRLAQAAKGKGAGRVHSRVGLLTKEGGDALDRMTTARLQAAADELGVAVMDLPGAARQRAVRRAVNDFSKAHVDARKDGLVIENIGYNTEIIPATATAPERLVVRDAIVSHETQGVLGSRPSINVGTTEDLGVELVGGVWPRRTAARTQFQYKAAYARQITQLAEGMRARGGARKLAVELATGVFRAGERVQEKVLLRGLRTLDKVVGTDWVAVGGATPKEAWAIVRSSLQDYGYTKQEMAELSNKILTRLGKSLDTDYPDFDLATYSVEDLMLLMRLQEINADIVLDDRLLAAVAPLREFIDGSRAFSDEFLRMDGNFRLFLEDPKGRELVEQLMFAQWQQKYREIAAKLPYGSSQRNEAIKDSMIRLQEDYESIQYTLGRMERSQEILTLEEALVETLEQSAMLEQRADDIAAKLPRRLGKRRRVPKELTPQYAVDDLVDTAISARNEAAELRAEIDRLRLDLQRELLPESFQRTLLIRDAHVKDVLKELGGKKLDDLQRQLDKLEQQYADYKAAFDEALDIPSLFIPERRGLASAFTTRASWTKASVPVEGTSEAIKGWRAGDFFVHLSFSIKDGKIVRKKGQYSLSYSPEGVIAALDGAPRLEVVAHGFRAPMDAKSFGDVATGLLRLADQAPDPLNILHEMGVAGVVIYGKNKKLFKPWEIQTGLGIPDATEWAAKAQRAVRDQRRLSAMRESIESKRREMGSLGTSLGERLNKPSKWETATQSNEAIHREIAAREKTIRRLERTADSASRGAERFRQRIGAEKGAIQTIARGELRSRMSAEVRQLRAGSRQASYEHARRRMELRDLLGDIRADAVDTAQALAVPRAIAEFNSAARLSVEAEAVLSPEAASRMVAELLVPEGTAPRSWKWQGVRKRLTDAQKRLPLKRQEAILAAQKGTQDSGHVSGRTYDDAAIRLKKDGIIIESLEAGSRSKLTERIDELQREIGELLNPGPRPRPAGGEDAMDLMQVLQLTEDASPYQIVTRVLEKQQESLLVDIQLARAVPGYDGKMDKLLDILETLTEEERFMVADFVKFEMMHGPGRGGRYVGLTAEQEHLRPVIQLFRGYYKGMLEVLQDNGMYKDWSLYEFLDRTNVSSYVPHTLAVAGFGLTGQLRQTARFKASGSRLGGFKSVEAPPSMFRKIPGAVHEINHAMRWQAAHGLVKYQAKLGMHGDELRILAERGAPIPQEMVSAVVRELPEELLYFETNPLLVAGNYSINAGTIVGSTRLWDDLKYVNERHFPEMVHFSESIGNPKTMITKSDAVYAKQVEAAAAKGEAPPPRVEGVLYSDTLEVMDEFAKAEGIRLYDEPFVRLGGADYFALITGGKFPSGDRAVLDAINLMVSRGENPAVIMEEMLTKFGLKLELSETKAIVRGQSYMPESLADFVRAQLGYSDLALTLRAMPPRLKEPAAVALDVLDNVNEIFKGMVTVVWPRFHGRNSWSGTIANAMIHGGISVSPELQKKFVIMMSKEGADVPFTWGSHTFTGREWQDIMRRHHVFPDRAAFADMMETAAGSGGAGFGPSEIERLKANTERVLQKLSDTGETRTEVWDELIDYVYGLATLKAPREAYEAAKHGLPSTGIAHAISDGRVGQAPQWGRLKSPAGKAMTGLLGGGFVGAAAGFAGGGPGVAIGSGLVGAAVGFLSTMPARKLVAIGGEIGQLAEVQLRGTNFVAGLELGHSIEEAAWYATFTHFSYQPHGQSWFSYNVLRRLFPFWTWNSKNFKKQLWLMRHRPQEYAALQHILTAATHHESSPELEASLPNNFSNRAVFHMREGAWHGFGIPFEAMTEMVRPLREGGLPFTAGAGGLLHPMILWGQEEISGSSLYFDKPTDQILGARDLEHAPVFLQEYFGAGPVYDPEHPDRPPVWKLGVNNHTDPGNERKPWIPTSPGEAATRWNRARKLNAFGAILSMWQQVRAESYQDAYGELTPSDVKVTPGQRAARLGFSWRYYSYNKDDLLVNKKAFSRLQWQLGEAYALDDEHGVDAHGRMKKKPGVDPFATEGSEELRQLLFPGTSGP